MAPEQINGQAVTAAADVFALGAVTAYAAQAWPPFGADDEAAVRHRVEHEPPWLEGSPWPVGGLAVRCMAKPPASRPGLDQVITDARVAPTAQLRAGPPTVTAASGPQPALPYPAEVNPAYPAEVNPVPARRRGSAGVIAAGASAGVVVLGLLTAGGVALAGHHSGAPSARGTARPRHSAAVAAPSPSLSLAAGVDPCVVGHWAGTHETQDVNIEGHIVVLSGPGPTEVDEPDGIQEDFFPPGGSTLTGTLNGQRWDFVFHGSATARYRDVGGTVVISDPTENGGIDILVNGQFDSSSQLNVATGPYQYTCGGNTMREIYAGGSGGSEVLTRESAG